MKSLIIFSMLTAQLAFSSELPAKLEPLKLDAKKIGCVNIDDEKAILQMKPKQQLALLALRKDKQDFERAIGGNCYRKYENTNLSTVSSNFDVNVVFNYGGEIKYTNDLYLNLENSKNLDDFKVKFDMAECIAREFNKKKTITKEMQVLPPVCSKISFINERSAEYRKPASVGPQPKGIKLK